jgi:hypothetical protein
MVGVGAIVGTGFTRAVVVRRGEGADVAIPPSVAEGPGVLAAFPS